MPKRGVFGFAFAGFDLQPRLDHVARGGKVGGGHSRNGACGQELQDADLFVGTFAKEIPLQMVVSWEVDAGKGHVAQEAGASTFVQADQAKILNDPHGGPAGDSFDGFGDFALDLKADFHNLEWVGKNLWLALLEGFIVGCEFLLPLDRRLLYHPQASHEVTISPPSLCSSSDP